LGFHIEPYLRRTKGGGKCANLKKKRRMLIRLETAELQSVGTEGRDPPRGGGGKRGREVDKKVK